MWIDPEIVFERASDLTDKVLCFRHFLDGDVHLSVLARLAKRSHGVAIQVSVVA
jgi:hypothetical protein